MNTTTDRPMRWLAFSRAERGVIGEALASLPGARTGA